MKEHIETLLLVYKEQLDKAKRNEDYRLCIRYAAQIETLEILLAWNKKEEDSREMTRLL